MQFGWLIAGGVCLVLLLWLAGSYNRFIRGKNLVAEAWSGIDVQLKRRANLIPNLVTVVKGYADHEQQLLESVTEARAQIRGDSVEARAGSEHRFQLALSQLFVRVEDYPELKADKGFRDLQSELAAIEDVIQRARRYYNGTVRDYNTSIQLFPANLLAAAFGFSAAAFFQLADENQRAVPEVSL